MMKIPTSHPKGLYLLFFTEMWERFSYYGMRAILVLYLTDSAINGGLGMEPKDATMLYGIFTGLVYFTPLIGGWLADRFLGQRRSVLTGGLLMMAGNFLLFARQNEIFTFAGLALIVLGNGFFKPNISTIVGKLYPEGDKRIDSAFTLFYMGINLGGMFAPLVAGTLANLYGYRWGFFSAAVGLAAGQTVFHLCEKRILGDIGTVPVSATRKKAAGRESLSKKEKDRITAIIILTLFSIVFFAGMEQAGSSMTLFAETNTDRTIGDFTIPTSWFMSINPFFILILAPLLSLSWTWLGRKGKNPSIPVKMGFGLLALGIGFLVLTAASYATGNDGHKVSPMFLVAVFFLHTVGELCLSPIGLSMVSKLSPIKTASLMMGLWFFATAFANVLSGYLASLTQSLGNTPVFLFIAAMSVAAGILLIAIRKPIIGKSHGKL